MLDLFRSTAFPSSKTARPLVLAHRGASADAPENTVPAFLEAARQGADGVELDVMPCATGEVVVCHDDWLDRLAGEHLRIRSASLAQLMRLDVGRRFSGAFTGTRIPTLVEALAAIPEGLVVNVELKSASVRDGGIARRAIRVLRSDGGRHRIVMSSFNPACLVRARARAPRVPTGIIFDAAQDRRLRETSAVALGLTALHPEHLLCTPGNVRAWHQRGWAVAAWTVDDPADVERCVEARVDAIITNRPALTLSTVKRLTGT